MTFIPPAHKQVLESMFGPARWELENIAIREGVARLVSSLGERILLSEDAYKSLKISDNRMFMGSGDHPGIKVDADDTLFVAAPGVRVTRKVVIEESCVFSGIHFTSTAIEDPNNIDVLVDITTSRATVIFERCVFEKGPTHATNAVNIAAGSKAQFIGCIFRPVMTSTGVVIDNAGVPADVNTVACSNITGRLHNNVTNIAETT
tara:strand:+ start:2073 stop:2687 length:615 start_codon:yes stop_codon:yes gene_type:complete